MPVGHNPLFHITDGTDEKKLLPLFLWQEFKGNKLLKDQKMIFHLMLLIFLIQDGKGEDGGAKDGIFTSNVDVQNLVTNLRELIPALKSPHGRDEDRRIKRVSQ